MKAKADNFRVQNELLKLNISSIEDKVHRAKAVEGKLLKMADGSKNNLNKLIRNVEEYKRVNERIKEILKGRIMQCIIRAILMADRDRNFIITEKELENLVIRLGMINGVDFNETRFRQLFAKRETHNVKTVLAICRDLMDDNVPKEKNIFQIETRDLRFF